VDKLPEENTLEFSSDKFWIISKEVFKIKDKKIVVEEKQGGIDNKLLELNAFKNSQDIYQLGIKTFILVNEEKLSKENLSIRTYTRFNHSLGARVVGMLWWEALEDEIRRTVFKGSDLNSWRTCLEVALLLHDVAHLPFSHLAEEIFTELGAYILGIVKQKHDEESLNQLDKDDKDKIKK